MGKDSKIEWCDHSFNPWWGCTKISAGCKNCYAEANAVRRGVDCFGAGKARKHMSEEYWAEPLKWDKAAGIRQAQPAHWKTRVFCGSMCDVFDAEAPITEREKLWRLIERTPNLTWMLLTKRPENIWNRAPLAWMLDEENRVAGTRWPENVQVGVTVENQANIWRMEQLLAWKERWGIGMVFVSVEPMLEKIELNGLRDVGLVICGCESGPARREFHENWARDLRDQCIEAGVPFFFKQGVRDGRVMKMPELDGKVWDEMPEGWE